MNSNRTHTKRNRGKRKMKKEILEIIKRTYEARPRAQQRYKNEVDHIEKTFGGKVRLDALTKAKEVYYETLRINEEKALNEVNTILDQATERVKTIITSTPDESFYRDIQIIKEMDSMGLLSDEKKSAYLEKYRSNYEATLYLTNLFFDTIKENLDNSAAIPAVGTGEPVKLLDIVRDEVKQVVKDCKYEDKSLSVAITLNSKVSPLGRDLDRLDRVLDNYK